MLFQSLENRHRTPKIKRKLALCKELVLKAKSLTLQGCVVRYFILKQRFVGHKNLTKV